MNSTAGPIGPAAEHQPPPNVGAPQPGLNVMAILALVFAFVFSPLGVVFGVVGRKQIARTGERGKGLATAGLVLGALFTILGVVLVIVAVSNGGNKKLAHAEIESQLTAQLTKLNGSPAESVSCPDDLDATVGASVNCSVTGYGLKQPATYIATTTSIVDKTVNFTITDGPNKKLPHTVVETQIADQMQKSNGTRPDAVSCPDDLAFTVGAEVTCTATQGGAEAKIVATATSIDGSTLNFALKDG